MKLKRESLIRKPLIMFERDIPINDSTMFLFSSNLKAKLNQRTNGPVNAHLSLLHIQINMFEYYGI